MKTTWAMPPQVCLMALPGMAELEKQAMDTPDPPLLLAAQLAPAAALR